MEKLSLFLVNLTENHRKFYEISYSPSMDVYMASWGKIGNPPIGGQTYNKSKIEELIRQKKAKGYKKVEKSLFFSKEEWISNKEYLSETLSNIISANGIHKIFEELIALSYDEAWYWNKKSNTLMENKYIKRAELLNSIILDI